MSEFASTLAPEDRVIVALDCGLEDALALADRLEGRARWMKVGMTLFYQEGPRAVAAFKERGFNVFCDLKLNDIPHQVRGAARSIALTGADMITVHASGGSDMMRAAVEGVEGACAEMGREAMPAVIAVTVLTSMDDATLRSIGVDDAPARQVQRLATLAMDAGVAGVVASPMEAPLLRPIVGTGLIVTPGVRPAGSAAGDQSRITTPAQALANGSTHIVVGRPITQAPDPVAAFDAIVEELR
ncbi:MAG: orotidine-5'-phosphate decarboxylase [Coriobacteriales bacterium]|jgi:orotidine-5'-phosphate decarboxylase